MNGDQQRYTDFDGMNIGVNIVQYLSCHPTHIDQGFLDTKNIEKILRIREMLFVG